MALSVLLHKVDETRRYCLYDLGTGNAAAARLKLYKSSGDVEVVRLSDDALPARPPVYLAQGIPRLHRYHEQNRYPDHDAWSA